MAIVFVSAATQYNLPGTSQSITITTGSGHFVIFYIEMDTGCSVSSVTDTGGSTYTRLAQFQNLGNTTPENFEIWGTTNSVASTSITATLNQSTTNFSVTAAAEYSGAAAFGHTNSAFADSGSTLATISVTTQDSNNFVVAWVSEGTGTGFTVTNGTVRATDSGSPSTATAIVLDNTAASASSVTCSGTISSQGWHAIAVELRTSAGVAAYEDDGLINGLILFPQQPDRTVVSVW